MLDFPTCGLILVGEKRADRKKLVPFRSPYKVFAVQDDSESPADRVLGAKAFSLPVAMARVICNIGLLCHVLTANVGGLGSQQAAVGILEASLAIERALRPDLFCVSFLKGFRD